MCTVSLLNFTILIINACSWNICLLGYVPGFCVCVCVLSYLYCLALLKDSQGDISLNGVHKSQRTSLCVYARGGEGLSEKSRLAEFVFCSSYTSSQLRDKTDKSTPPLFPPHLTLLVSSFLFILLYVSSLSPLPFLSVLPYSAGVDFRNGNDLPVM